MYKDDKENLERSAYEKHDTNITRDRPGENNLHY